MQCIYDFEYMHLSLPTATVHPDMCGAMGVCKHNCSASGGEHCALHGSVPQGDDQPHGRRCCQRCPAGT